MPVSQRNLTLDPQYDSQFVNSVIDWAQKKVGGGVGHYRYSDPKSPSDPVKGMPLYKKWLKEFDTDYYPRRCDQDAFMQATTHARKLISGPVTLIVQGPGDSFNEKEFEFASHFEDVAGCIINDVSVEAANHAKNTAISKFNLPDTQSVALSHDFFHEALLDGTQVKGHPNFKIKGTPVMIVAGLTLSNVKGFPNQGLPKNEVTRILNLWRGDLCRAYQAAANQGKKPENKPHLITSIDTTQDKDTIETAYEGQAEFTKNFAFRIERDAPVIGNFDPHAFKVNYVWHPGSHVLTHDLIPLCNMTFQIAGIDILMGKDNPYAVNNTYKYPLIPFAEIVRNAIYRPRATVMDSENRVAAQYLEAGLT